MMKLSGLVGMASICGFLSLLMGRNTLSSALSPPTGTPVLLSHRCKTVGDGRPTFIRYRFDHTSLVNDVLEPVEDDLRRELVGIMASRQERIVFFAADERLMYGDVAGVLANLERDDPSLSVVLLMKDQVDVKEPGWRSELETCV